MRVCLCQPLNCRALYKKLEKGRNLRIKVARILHIDELTQNTKKAPQSGAFTCSKA